MSSLDRSFESALTLTLELNQIRSRALIGLKSKKGLTEFGRLSARNSSDPSDFRGRLPGYTR